MTGVICHYNKPILWSHSPEKIGGDISPRERKGNLRCVSINRNHSRAICYVSQSYCHTSSLRLLQPVKRTDFFLLFVSRGILNQLFRVHPSIRSPLLIPFRVVIYMYVKNSNEKTITVLVSLACVLLSALSPFIKTDKKYIVHPTWTITGECAFTWITFILAIPTFSLKCFQTSSS